MVKEPVTAEEYLEVWRGKVKSLEGSTDEAAKREMYMAADTAFYHAGIAGMLPPDYFLENHDEQVLFLQHVHMYRALLVAEIQPVAK